VIRSKTDYAVVIFADLRYTRNDKRKKLPLWVQKQMEAPHTNLAADVALEVARQFLLAAAQPLDLEEMKVMMKDFDFDLLAFFRSLIYIAMCLFWYLLHT
jgi:DNA excision repair protein ERCC-2